MLIGLKGDNYYSKVFKRVNYKLWNNTFWVVITFSPCISCIIHDLGALRVAQKIQVIGFLQVDDLFTVGS